MLRCAGEMYVEEEGCQCPWRLGLGLGPCGSRELVLARKLAFFNARAGVRHRHNTQSEREEEKGNEKHAPL